MPSITPSLWFDNNLEEAAQFYTSIFPNSTIEAFSDTTKPVRARPVMWFTGRLCSTGNRFLGINGGPAFAFTEAVSLRSSARTRTRSTTTGTGCSTAAKSRSAAGSRTDSG